jgi:hypothetical protein
VYPTRIFHVGRLVVAPALGFAEYYDQFADESKNIATAS